ncbi:tetratricopeptide repeat protein [Luteitalea sp.]
MSAERYSRLKAIVLQARALAPAQRRDHLDVICAGDTALRADVESLLTHDEAVPAILQSGALTAVLSASDALDLPCTLGPYRLCEVVGEGGMGIVYRAEQRTPIEREVAVKLIRADVASAGVIARFAAEREVLARMDHPHIARIIDAGTSPHGPYFVMDLVRGVPVTTHAVSRALPLGARLDLFLQACEAVRHAHLKGIVHRDLKPSNLLVADQDGRPALKVIDFGIAKAVEPGAAGASVTGAGVAIGTPDYMSPEQAGVLDGADVDTRTDVFSLGVVLYELLAGRRPRQFRTGSPGEFQQCLAADGVPPPSVVARRHADRVAAAVPTDLDTITLKAIDVLPDRRYQSVEQLADDVRRHLAGVPVLARPATWRYRAVTFVRRHRAAVVASTAAVVLLGALLAVHTVRVGRERDRARAEAAKAAQVTTFLTELFEAAEPDQANGRDVSARQLLERGAQRVDRELAGDAPLQGTMMRVIGSVYRRLGAYRDAAPLLDGAVARHARAAGHELEWAASLQARGSLAYNEGDYPRAAALLQQALELRRPRLPVPHPALVDTLQELGFVDVERGELAAAQRHLEEAVGMARALGDGREGTATLGDALVSLSRLRLVQGSFADAQRHLREALAIRRRVLGADHSDVGAALDGLAEALRRDGQLAEAEPLFREAVDHARRVLGEDHPVLLVRLANLANVVQNRGRHAEALTMLEDVLARYRALPGPQHPNVSKTLNSILTAQMGLGHYADAGRTGREALALAEANASADPDSVASVLNNLALIEAEQRAFAEAARLQRRTLEIDRRVLGQDHRYVAMDHTMIGTFLLADGEIAAAEPALREGVAMMRRVAGPDDRSLAVALYNLGMYLTASRQFEEAERVAREALRIRTARLPEGHWEIGLAQTLLGEALAGLGRDAEAAPLLEGGFALVLTERPGRHRDDARRRVEAFAASRGRDLTTTASP